MRDFKPASIIAVITLTLLATGFAAPDTDTSDAEQQAVEDTARSEALADGRKSKFRPTTKRQKHANWIFRKAYSTCEKKVDTSSLHQAVVAVVFDVQKDGSFEVTATYNQYMGSQDTVTSIAECMAAQANDGNRFPKGKNIYVAVRSRIARKAPDAPLKLRKVEVHSTRNHEGIYNWSMSAPAS